MTPDPGVHAGGGPSGPQSPGAVAVVVSKGEPKSPVTDGEDGEEVALDGSGKRSAAVNPNVRREARGASLCCPWFAPPPPCPLPTELCRVVRSPCLC